ncbi:MAG TPA: acetoacetate--CoA ligase [Bauldia sp.]|nr:acetoacetate--CoA ligase [Bauldia sp.]
MEERPLWTPSPQSLADHPLTHFTALAEKRTGRRFPDYDALHAWSVADPASFWDLLWDFCGVIGEKGGIRLAGGDKMPGASFFPEARLNFAENLLRRNDDSDAIVFRGEDKVRRRMTWRELHALVSRLQQAMRAHGVGKGDRVAALLPNLPEAIAGMLATASLGAVWSSASPDFGPRGALDRFGQIAPKLFLAADGYWYAGKRLDIADKVREIAAGLNPPPQSGGEPAPGLTRGGPAKPVEGAHPPPQSGGGGPAKPVEGAVAIATVIIPYLGTADEAAATIPGAVTLDAFLAPFAPKPVEFARTDFSDPLYILFSSGTTGIPKCIVHSAGGTLLQHLKEHRLHSGVRPGERVFYFTTCGWMMWNWLASALASDATLILYDGSPFHPGPEALFDYAEAERIDFFGTSAKYIDAVKKSGIRLKDLHDLSSLRMLASTGSPLAPESFDFVYDAIASDLHLASISGGTDIVSCFVLGIPSKPVWRGEIQGPGLGMAVDVYDESGRPLRGGKGELVCTRPFPSMPVGFWNDPDGRKYRAAYFERFDNIWCHGDFAEWTAHGGIVIHGRSDATLNPGGVRIGTAEIYRQVEQIPEVVEALAIGQDWEGDVRIVLFVRLHEMAVLDEPLLQRIRSAIRTGASPRHVPARIVAVADIPRTKSGKIVELAVREVVHGRPVKNREALANPEALELFRNIEALKR